MVNYFLQPFTLTIQHRSWLLLQSQSQFQLVQSLECKNWGERTPAKLVLRSQHDIVVSVVVKSHNAVSILNTRSNKKRIIGDLNSNIQKVITYCSTQVTHSTFQFQRISGSENVFDFSS